MFQYVGIEDYRALPEEPGLEYKSFNTLREMGQFILDKFRLYSADEDEIKDILTNQIITMRNGERIFLAGKVKKKMDVWEESD